MRIFHFFSIFIIGLALATGCASQKLRNDIAEKSSLVRFVNYDDPDRCNIHKKCSYLRSFACWGHPGEFESKCEEDFRELTVKHDGDTYFYPVKPQPEIDEDLIRVFGDIYKCSDGPLKLEPKVQQRIIKNQKYSVEAIRFIDNAYQKDCNVVQDCQESVKLKCELGDNTVFRRCYTLLKQNMLNHDLDVFVIDEENSQNVFSGTGYICPAAMKSILPLAGRRVYGGGSSNYTPELSHIEFNKIPPIVGHSDVIVINAQLSKDITLIYRYGQKAFYGHLQETSETLKNVLNRELAIRKFNVKKEARNILEVSILGINAYNDGVHARGLLAFEVKYGNDQKYSHKVSGAGKDINELINRMIADAAIDILNYHKIRSYLVSNITE